MASHWRPGTVWTPAAALVPLAIVPGTLLMLVVMCWPDRPETV